MDSFKGYAANPDVLVAGFMATPERSDRKGLCGIFSNVCDTVTIRELVQLGFLVPRADSWSTCGAHKNNFRRCVVKATILTSTTWKKS